MTITGQLFLRDKGRGPNGKRLMMVVGVIGVPEDTDLEGEHQYTISNLTLCDGVDLSERVRGFGASNLLTESIWRV